MPFLTIREILGKVEDFHHEFGQRLQEAEGSATNDEAKLTLSFLATHQKELADALGTMERESPESLASLNEWVQFDTTLEDPRSFLAEFKLDKNANSEEVLRVANQLDVCLFCLYKSMAKGSSTPKVQRLFGRLARLELDHQKARGASPSYY